ncbi:hypothetical protein Tco_0643014, partial [Tanacetum coccineum]
MSSISDLNKQKADLELFPRRIDLISEICSMEVIPHGFLPEEPHFSPLDALCTTSLTICQFSSCTDIWSILGISFLNDVVVDQKHKPWRTFATLINITLSGKTSEFTYQIDNKDFKKQEKMYYPRFTKVIIHYFLIQEETLSWRNKIGMHTSNDDYLINTLSFVSRKEASQDHMELCCTSQDCQKFKKASPSKKDSIPVQADEEPVQKGKRVKRSAKKSSTTPAAGIVIRETPVKTKSTGKEKVDVTHGKGIELLSEVALDEKAQLKEVRKKSLRDFHKTHPSGSGTVAKKPPSVEKITPTVTSEGTGDKLGVPDVARDDSTESSRQENESEEQESNSEHDEESDDDNQEEEEVDQENESE